MRHCVVQYGALGIDYQVATGLASAVVENCTVQHNGGRGIYLYASGGANLTATVTGNTVLDNTGAGIRVHGKDSNTRLTATVTGNAVSQNGSYGVYGYWESDAQGWGTDRGQHGRADGGTGIYVYNYNSTNVTDLQVTGNTVSATATDGIYCSTYYGLCYPYIEGNEVYNNTGIGIRVFANQSGTHDPEIVNNTVYENGGDGVRVHRYLSTPRYGHCCT